VLADNLSFCDGFEEIGLEKMMKWGNESVVQSSELTSFRLNEFDGVNSCDGEVEHTAVAESEPFRGSTQSKQGCCVWGEDKAKVSCIHMDKINVELWRICLNKVPRGCRILIVSFFSALVLSCCTTTSIQISQLHPRLVMAELTKYIVVVQNLLGKCT
jgi:hypothetical protein